MRIIEEITEKDTLFCDAIIFLKKNKKVASLAILKIVYEKNIIDRCLNEVGGKILESDGEAWSVAEILTSYY